MALLLSVTQLFLNTPLLINFYMEPELVVRGIGTHPEADELIGSFEVNNEGRASATNVEIGLTIQKNSRIWILPNIEAQITEVNNFYFITIVRINIPKLTPGETVKIIVRPGVGEEKLNEEIADIFVKLGTKEIPLINFIKSDQGMGRNLTNSVDRQILEGRKINRFNTLLQNSLP